MTTLTRNCANCASFNRSPSDGDPACWNMVSIIEFYGTPQQRVLEPGLTDWCSSHQTPAEDIAQTAFIDAHRDELMAAIFEQAERQERQDQARSDLLAAETSAERITRDLLRKLGLK